MISLIVCHRNPDLLNSFKSNVEISIGVPYELIVIDNSKGELGICAAYNHGANQATFSILIFVHEDVLFHTPNWGKKVLTHFEDPAVGALGVAGCQFFGKKGFAYSGKHGFGHMHILQHFSNGAKTELLVNPGQQNSVRVVNLDGVMIGTRKNIWVETPFDEINLREFHCYDLDFSLQVSQQHEVRVVFDILLEHFSPGNYSEQFLAQFALFKKKWNHQLPQYLPNFDVSKLALAEWQMFIAAYRFYPRNFSTLLNLSRDAFLFFRLYPKPYFLIKALFFLLRYCVGANKHYFHAFNRRH